MHAICNNNGEILDLGIHRNSNLKNHTLPCKYFAKVKIFFYGSYSIFGGIRKKMKFAYVNILSRFNRNLC